MPNPTPSPVRVSRASLIAGFLAALHGHVGPAALLGRDRQPARWRGFSFRRRSSGMRSGTGRHEPGVPPELRALVRAEQARRRLANLGKRRHEQATTDPKEIRRQIRRIRQARLAAEETQTASSLTFTADVPREAH